MASLNYRSIARHIDAHGGITIDLDGNRPREGYAVAIAGQSQRVPRTPYSIELARSIYAYVVHHGRELRDPGAHLGAWVDGDAVELEVSFVIADRAAAEGFAFLNAQRFIYDLANGVNIEVNAEVVA